MPDDLRSQIRRFVAAAMADAHDHADPSDLTGLREDFERAMQREAGRRGWLGLEPDEQAIFNEEVARADAPLIDTGMTLAGPAIGAHRPELLPRLRSGEVTACIAYTEAGAGSDLAAIAATGRRVGGDVPDRRGAPDPPAHAQPSGASDPSPGWVLDGTKVLVTGAHKADWCVTVVRTALEVADPVGSALTMFLVPMDTPGVRVRRRTTMNGWTLADIDFVDVHVGDDAVLGEVGAGWRQMLHAVAAERSGTFWVGFAEHVVELFVDHVRAGTELLDDPFARDALGAMAAELRALQRLSAAARARRDDAALAAMVKVRATELLQELAQTATEVSGMAGLAWSPLFGERTPGAAGGGRFAWEYLERVHPAISVGANEVQRDLIARVGLGLPRRR